MLIITKTALYTHTKRSKTRIAVILLPITVYFFTSVIYYIFTACGAFFCAHCVFFVKTVKNVDNFAPFHFTKPLLCDILTLLSVLYNSLRGSSRCDVIFMKTFRPKLFDCLKGYTRANALNDIIAGVIVAIIALPLSIALAIASGVSPEQGLYTAIIAGLTIALLGGSRVNISGPTAAFATIVAGIVATHGASGLIIATIMAGIILILLGVLRLGSLIKYIPVTITTGFTAGIAITIVIGQIKDFLGLTYPDGTHAVETTEKLAAVFKSLTTINLHALLIGLIGMAILILWPMLAKSKRLGRLGAVCAKIPPSIIAVTVGILLVSLTPLEVSTIGSLYPELSSGFPTPSLPSLELETVIAVIPSAFTIAILAAIESLLSCVVSDGMIGDRHNSNTELISLGIGNVASGIFGGIPATGAIARTAANVKNGGRTPIAGAVHALVLILFTLVLMPLVKLIPMPIIAAILFMVAYNMSEWRHFVHLVRTSAFSDVLVLVVTFVLTVVFDLVVAIAVGLVLAVLLFMKRMGDVTSVRRWTQGTDTDKHSRLIPEGVCVYEINGPIFFADKDKLSFELDEGTRAVIIRMTSMPTIDATAMSILYRFAETCIEKNVRVIFSHVAGHPYSVMKRAGLVDLVGEEAFVASIDEALALASK